MHGPVQSLLLIIAGKMAHWGTELGDVLLAREMYADAKVQFERVLAFDADNVKARLIQPDGTHVRVERKPGETLLNSQEALIGRARHVGQTPAASGQRATTPRRLTPLRTPPPEAH